MTAPLRNACSVWATEDDVSCDPDDFSGTVLEDSLAMATDVLFMLSGRQFPGSCQDTVRPVHDCCSRKRCGGVSEISLGVSPITSIVSVKVDGETLDSDRYRIDDFATLVRLPDADGGSASWPCCQDMELDSSEEDTFEVTFTYGTFPPQMGVVAAAQLGCEIAKAQTAGMDCNLPQRTQNVTRQGVSISLIDPNDFLENGMTGLYLCDLFLQSYNPHKLSRPPGIMSPDIPSSRRVGT